MAYKCELCGNIYISRKGVRKHIKNDHKKERRLDYNPIGKAKGQPNNEISRYYVKVYKKNNKWIEIPSAHKQKLIEDGERK